MGTEVFYPAKFIFCTLKKFALDWLCWTTLSLVRTHLTYCNLCTILQMTSFSVVLCHSLNYLKVYSKCYYCPVTIFGFIIRDKFFYMAHSQCKNISCFGISWQVKDKLDSFRGVDVNKRTVTRRSCSWGWDLATVRAAVYFLSLLLATSWPKFAIIECMVWTFSSRFSC